MLKRIAVISMLVPVMLVIQGCSKEPGEMNVLLVTVDTLRTERLGCYGYGKAETPVADRLAAEGVLFEKACTPAPLTLPAHASLMTSLYPVELGIRDNGMASLAGEYITLAEIMAGADYKTGAVVGAHVLDSKYGLDQGFAVYNYDIELPDPDHPVFLIPYRRGGKVTDAALEWLKNTAGDGKFFLWVHYFDPHVPYDPPEGFRSGSDYDGEVAYADYCLGGVLDYLEESGLLDETLIVYASDHGESLGDHGVPTHGYYIYQSTVRIPLIVKFPGGDHRGKRINALAGLIDVMPTVLDFIGAEVPGGVKGKSLRPLIEEGNPVHERLFCESMMARTHFGWSGLAGMITEEWKMIAAPNPELYSMETDGEELRNLIGEKPRIAGEMRKIIDAAYLDTVPRYKAGEVELSAEEKENLKSLGYLGAGETSVPLTGRRVIGGEDPKGKAGLWLDYFKAASASSHGAYDDALKIYGDMLEKSGGHNYKIHSNMADVYRRMERYGEALEHYRKAEPFINEGGIIYNMGKMLILMGRSEEGAEKLEKAIEMDPGFEMSFVELAKYYAALNRPVIAVETLEKGLKHSPDSNKIYSSLGIVLSMSGDLDGGITHFKKALSVDPLHLEARLNLAYAYYRKGEYEKCREELDRVFEQSPGNSQGLRLLSMLGAEK